MQLPKYCGDLKYDYLFYFFYMVGLRQIAIVLTFHTEPYNSQSPFASTWYTSSTSFRQEVFGSRPSNSVFETPCRRLHNLSCPADTIRGYRHIRRNTCYRKAWRILSALHPHTLFAELFYYTWHRGHPWRFIIVCAKDVCSKDSLCFVQRIITFVLLFT